MKGFLKYYLVLALMITAVWAGWWVFVSFLSHDVGKQGQVGDLFGGINALFSGLALAGVVMAVIMQSRELQLQREELRMTREELSKSAEANQRAAEALNKQIEIQMKSVELSALSTVITNIHAALSDRDFPRHMRDAMQDAQATYVTRLRIILEEVQKENG